MQGGIYMAIKLSHGENANITEHAITNPYSIKSAIAEGYISSKGLDRSKLDKNILEQFGITLSEYPDNTDIVESLITENNFNPLLTMHQLHEAGDTESIARIREAYEQFVEIVNSHSTDEMAEKNALLIKNVLEVVNLAILK